MSSVLAEFAHQIILVIFFLIIIVVAVKLGINFRKKKNAKVSQENKLEEEKMER